MIQPEIIHTGFCVSFNHSCACVCLKKQTCYDAAHMPERLTSTHSSATDRSHHHMFNNASMMFVYDTRE